MPETPSRRAVFLDRDGTIIEDLEYCVDVERLHPLPGAVRALRKLQEVGYLLIVATNQSGVARGLFKEEELREFHRVMLDIFHRQGVRFSDIIYCPHYAKGEVAAPYAVPCDCRKPAPGMLLRAAEEHGIDLKLSWMVGDRAEDIGAGCAAGCRTIRVLTGPETPEGDILPDFTAADISAAAEIILDAG